MSSVPGVLTSLTKGALNAATKALAIEHAKNGLRVNAVSAGIIKTPMHHPETHPFFASLHPMGRWEKYRKILYLDSANFITGEILHVDGGQASGHYTISTVEESHHDRPHISRQGCVERRDVSPGHRTGQKWRASECRLGGDYQKPKHNH